ncbi:MAG: septum formation initiator family protein [Acidobacteriota bacterium]|nr:septum formation initiator family protein [Acidobacteriota bacterium]
MTDASDINFTPLPRRRRDNPWLRRGLLVVTLVVFVDAVFGDRGVAEMRKAQRAYSAAHADLVRLKSTNGGLREQARRLSEDPSTIEDVARKELGLMREGEVLFVVKPVR